MLNYTWRAGPDGCRGSSPITGCNGNRYPPETRILMTGSNSIIYEGFTIPYDITYSPRRNSISIVVHHTKRVEIKAPSGTPASYIHGLAGKKVTWIVKRLMVLDSMAELQVERNYHDREVFFFLGAPITLSVTEGTATGGIRCAEGHFFVNTPRSLPGPDQAQYTRKLVQDWYREQATRNNR